ncbi:alpha/beta fold hydrolase [Streptomyces hoynatensis]|uniref:Alpha/beta fold hydrolase n=1 Tax=Streptomyces hoynatensis TaxID=1141874 RepID=A0A3A9YJ01_9ACTN|nr:alpha/beta fold hydrolase [Streptomyces hoynatensis]
MVHRERVAFTSGGDTLAGDLYLPPGADGTAFPAVAVAGSWTTVKEQMAGLYAAGLARRGIAALAFDFRGFGESGGAPRDLESPVRKIADLRSAIDFLATHPAVAPGRVGELGICAGAGYAVVNAAGDGRVRSLGLVAPWLHDAQLVEAIYGGAQAVAERREAGLAAQRRYAETGIVEYVPGVSTENAAAAMYGPFDYYLDADRGAVPQWGNRFAVMGWPGWLGFDPIAAAPLVTAPTVIVHSPDAAVPDGVRRFHEVLPARKELIWQAGGQMDFYDQESHVEAALDAVAEHFASTL